MRSPTRPESPLIPPDVQARLKGLRLATRAAARGPAVGLHLGRSQGAGLEFAQYRAYEPGDELRHVDWKLYARSDRFFVRDAVRDSALSVWVLLDTSASMAQADADRPDYSKLAAAKIFAACVAEIALRQGDSFGLATLGANLMRAVPPAGGARHRDRVERELLQIECAGRWPSESSLQPLWQRISPESLVVVISDGLDEGLHVLVERLSAARRQVLSLGLVSCEERDFPFAGGFTFRDPETGEERRVDAPAERSDFLARFAAARHALTHRFAHAGVRHVDHVLDEAPDAALRRLLFGS